MPKVSITVIVQNVNVFEYYYIHYIFNGAKIRMNFP